MTSENHGAAKRRLASEIQAGEDSVTRLTLTLDVLGVREDDAWCAIALEMSLRGYGETFDDALDALVEAIEAQVTFAVQHDNLDQIFHTGGASLLSFARGCEAGRAKAQAP